MNLDDLDLYRRIDPSGVGAQIAALPDRLETAWQKGLNADLPNWIGIERVLLLDDGAPGGVAHLLEGIAASVCSLPLTRLPAAGSLPGWASGPGTLAIALADGPAAAAARESNSRVIAIQPDDAPSADSPQFTYPAQPFGHSSAAEQFGLGLAALQRLDLLPGLNGTISGASAAMRRRAGEFAPHIPAVHNPAKRTAGQMVGRWVVMIGADYLEPAACYWKNAIHQYAKALASAESLDAAAASTLQGVLHPPKLWTAALTVFLRAGVGERGRRTRLNRVRKAFMLQGVATDLVDAWGEAPLERLWTLLFFGEYTAYYLAAAYQIDPAIRIPAIQ
jgi:glucose/mannose-6-phosphate isomerase